MDRTWSACCELISSARERLDRPHNNEKPIIVALEDILDLQPTLQHRMRRKQRPARVYQPDTRVRSEMLMYSGKSSWRICGGMRGRVDFTRLFSRRSSAVLKDMAISETDER